MRHQWQPDRFGDFERHVQRRYARVAAGAAAHTHLDADDQVGVFLHHPNAFVQVEQAQVLAFADHHLARKSEYARIGQVQQRQYAHRQRRLDHMLAKTREVAGAGCSCVDKGGGGAAACQRHRVDADRGAAPVNMGVQVDQAGREHLAAQVADFGAGPGLQLLADGGDDAGRETHVGDAVDVL